MIEYVLIQSGKIKPSRTARIIRAQRYAAKEIKYKDIEPTIACVANSTPLLLASSFFEDSYNLFASVKSLLLESKNTRHVLDMAKSEEKTKCYIVSLHTLISTELRDMLLRSKETLLVQNNTPIAIKLNYAEDSLFNKQILESFSFPELLKKADKNTILHV